MAFTPARKDNRGEPFPTKQLLVLGFCRLAEPVAFTSVISYNFAMVRDIKGPVNASFYAGLLISAFGIGEASTAILWGHLSDRRGRKPVILLGLLGTVLSSLILGFATNYWVALLSRFLGGLLNGNVAVMQTMVAELVKNPAHEPRAYSIAPFAWSLGSIAGSALGGYATQPARFYPKYFAPDGIFGRYPYLLPNVVASVCILLAALQAAVFLKETNPRCIKQDHLGDYAEGPVVDERTPLQGNGMKDSNLNTFISGKRRPSFVAGNMPTLTEPDFDVRRSSFASIRSFKSMASVSAIESTMNQDDEHIRIDASETSSTVSKVPMLWIVAVALMCYHQMAFMSVFPIFILDLPQTTHGLDLRGGLGLSVHDIGRYMSINSLWSLFVQLLVLPVFMSKIGIWKSIVSLTLFCPFVDIFMSLVTALPRPENFVYFVFALQAFCQIIIYPGLLIMLKNSTAPEALGRVNGMAVSASSAARTIAPPLIGIFYSTLGSAGAWWSSAIFALFAIVELYFIPKPKQEDAAIIRKASVQVNDDV